MIAIFHFLSIFAVLGSNKPNIINFGDSFP